MSHFYGSLEGNRGVATRCGTKESGIHTHTRGWNLGARVSCYINEHGQDECQIFLTGGTSYPSMLKNIGRFVKDEEGNIKQI